MESTYRRSMSVAAGLWACCMLGAFLAPPASANTTLTFEEPEKGSTFKFVDVAPQAPKKHGFPTAISPGIRSWSPTRSTQGGKTTGKLRAMCTATANAKGKNAFANAHSHLRRRVLLRQEPVYTRRVDRRGWRRR